MKEKLYILCLLCFFVTISVAQQPHIIVPDSSLITSDVDSLDIIKNQALRQAEMNRMAVPKANDSLKVYPRFNVWKIDARTGERYATTPDTILFNYQHTTLPDGASVAMGYLGNLG